MSRIVCRRSGASADRRIHWPQLLVWRCSAGTPLRALIYWHLLVDRAGGARHSPGMAEKLRQQHAIHRIMED